MAQLKNNCNKLNPQTVAKLLTLLSYKKYITCRSYAPDCKFCKSGPLKLLFTRQRKVNSNVTKVGQFNIDSC